MMKRWALSRNTLSGCLLTLAFFAAFVPYVAGITIQTQLLSAALFLIIGIVLLPLMYNRRAGNAARSLLLPRFILFGLVLPITPCVVAVAGAKWDSLGYALLMTAVLAACQIILLSPMQSDSYSRALFRSLPGASWIAKQDA
ncbi:MAG: hypothetical protein P8018_09860 [Acidobacteriota bacterium]